MWEKQQSPIEHGVGRNAFAPEGTPLEELLDGEFERNERIDALTASINFSMLHDVLEDEFVRSGGVRGDMNFVPPERILAMRSDRAVQATYFSAHNAIGMRIDGDSIPTLDTRHVFFQSIPHSQHFAELALSDEVYERLRAVLAVIHEEVHATSAIHHTHDRGLFTAEQMLRVGYREYASSEGILSKRIHSVGEVFNEGVTELVALQTLMTYYERIGSDDMGVIVDDAIKFFACFNNDVFTIGFNYKEHVEFVRLFVEYAAHVSGASRGAVWNSIVRGYFAGGDLFDDAVVAEFRENGLTEVLDLFGRADNDLTDIDDSERVRQALGHVNAQLYEQLPTESKNYLYAIFNDPRGMTARPIGGEREDGPTFWRRYVAQGHQIPDSEYAEALRLPRDDVKDA